MVVFPEPPLGFKTTIRCIELRLQCAAGQEYVSLREARKPRARAEQVPIAERSGRAQRVRRWTATALSPPNTRGLGRRRHDICEETQRRAGSRGLTRVATEKSRTPGASGAPVEWNTWNGYCCYGMSSMTWPALAAMSPFPRPTR